MRAPSSTGLSAVAVAWLAISAVVGACAVGWVLLMLMMPGGSRYDQEAVVRVFAFPAYVVATAVFGAGASIHLLLRPRAWVATTLLLFAFLWPATTLAWLIASPGFPMPSPLVVLPVVLVVPALSAAGLRGKGSRAYLRLREENAAREAGWHDHHR